MISIYSLVTAIAIYNIFLLFVYLLRRNKYFLMKYGTQTLAFITILGILRLFSPLDFEAAYVIRSKTVLPAIQGVLSYIPIDTVPVLTIGRIFTISWFVVAAVYIIKDAILLVRAYLRRRRYQAIESHQLAALADQLCIPYPIVVSPQVSTPHTAGVIRPRIYLPPLDLSDAEWKYVLRHEVTHIRSCDLTIKLFYCLLEALFWWNPVSHLFMHELDALLEFRCDIKVTDTLNDIERTQYLSAMISVMRQILPTKELEKTISVNLVDPAIDLKQRFELVLQYNRNKPMKLRNAICILMALLFVLSYFIVFQPVFYPTQGDLTDVYTVTESTSFIQFDGEQYVLYINGKAAEIVPTELLSELPYALLEIINIANYDKLEYLDAFLIQAANHA